MALDIRRLPRLNGDFFPALLLLSIYGFALSLLLGRGTYQPSLYLCALATAGMLVFRRDEIRPERPTLVFLGLGSILLAQGLAMAGDRLTGGFHIALSWTMLVVFAIQLLPERFRECRPPSHAAVAAVCLLVFVLAQVAAYPLKLNKAGLFSNLHYLALFSVITLPLLFYFALAVQGARRGLYALALVGDFWLLMKTQSRPGFVALLAGALATLPFLSRPYRWAALLAIVLLPTLLYVTGVFGFAARVDDLAANFLAEERVAIWRETWAMQTRSSALEWWLGHGFGGYFWDYQSVSSFHGVEEFTFPHNYFLELLYSHGIAGLAIVSIAYGLFFGKLASATSSCHDTTQKLVGVVLIGMASADLVLGFLTLPLFSRHNLYPFSLILGASLYYLRNNAPHERT